MTTQQKEIAVVTGGASGIGLATVTLLAQRNIHVIALDRDAALLAELENRERIYPLCGDVSANPTWDNVLELSQSQLGTAPSMYVANAATVIVGTTLDLGDDDWHTILETNLMGTVRGARALLPSMLKAGRGAMVMVGSIDAYMGEQGLAAYCASKGAILQYSRALAVDHARQGLRVNCVCPGVTDTPLFRYHLSKSEAPQEVLAARTERNPLGRLLAPEDVARTIAFLLSDEAAGITGALVPVDAGLSTSFEFRSGDAWGDMV
ncbi:MAG: SDR family oxidoreductase [Candidatus Latescibacteria bacterium]|nr:SDR family oxidoreductase [Candidatus Latescibacterota bacterium]